MTAQKLEVPLFKFGRELAIESAHHVLPIRAAGVGIIEAEGGVQFSRIGQVDGPNFQPDRHLSNGSAFGQYLYPALVKARRSALRDVDGEPDRLSGVRFEVKVFHFEKRVRPPTRLSVVKVLPISRHGLAIDVTHLPP